MKTKLLTAILLIFFASAGMAQAPKFQKGFITSNLLTFISGSTHEQLVPGTLLRYKAGLLFRSRLTDKLKLPKPFPKPKKGVAALDYGLSFVANGYNFRYRGFEQYGDQWQIELPVLLVLYDRSDFWLPRKMRRKGYATFARCGFKANYLFRGRQSSQVETSTAKLTHTSQYGGLNFYSSVGAGLLRTNSKGHTFSISISGNIGWLSKTAIDIEYQNQNGTLEEVSANSNGSYLAIETIYLFDKKENKKSKGIPPPLIFNPRY